MFAHITGNERAKSYLQRMVEKNLIGHSLLFAGPESAGKEQFAIALAEKVMGVKSPVDLHELRPEGKTGMHSIDSMRRFGDEVMLPPTAAFTKVFIIYEAERMLVTSANALLKTFEEPPKKTLIILLSASPQLLLPTVRSRCRAIFFEGSVTKQGSKESSALILDLLAEGCGSLKELTKRVEVLCKVLEEHRKALEAALTEEIFPEGANELLAVQKDQLQKEVDGAVALRMAEEMHLLFETILGWYRDLHLLHVQGNRAQLMHLDRHHALVHAYQKGSLLPLEVVQKAIYHAKLSFERSTTIKTCLESLFLRLGIA